MSGPALKWAMQPDDEQPDRPAISAEKRLLLIALAYEANRFDNTIREPVPVIAKRYGIGRQSALRYAGEFMDDGPLRDTGERTGYHNRVAVLQFVTEWSPGAASRRRSKRPSNSTSVRTIQTRSNSTSVDTIQQGFDAENAPRMVRVDELNGTSVHHRIVRVDASNGMSVDTIQGPPLYNGLQELPITPQEKHNAHRRAPSPLSRTDDERGEVTESAAQQSPATTANAMVEVFYAHCEANVRGEVERGCLRFAEEGLSVEDMREAIRTAKRQEKKLARKPRWASVRNVLDGVLHTRESVITAPALARGFSAQDVHGARQLEAIYACHFEKPAWTATRGRWDMGEWLLLAVSREVDEAMFKAACLDAKCRANGKPPTWKHVKTALEARESGTQQHAGDKPFFDWPGVEPGATRHWPKENATMGPLIDPRAPEPLRLACHLLALVQRDRCVSCAGDAAHVHTFAEACRDALAVVSNDHVMSDRLGRVAIGMCQRHGTLTRRQA